MSRNLLHPKASALLGALALVVLGPASTAAAVTAGGPGSPDVSTRPFPSAPAGAACAPTTASALAAFFDAALPGRLAREHVPGAVLSVVSGGRTVLARGYGTADAERGTPFDPDRSLVRIASITKLFTWTAVMQQVQAGRLDLDADINRYLGDVRIPATYPEPVTLATLMDHTSGFEGQVIGTAARTSADVEPLEEYLARHVPARIRPPGEISAYSNYGAALAGYVVSRVSGEPYESYVQHHLFTPLAMTHSTAAEPVPAALAGDQARSYDSEVSPPRRIPFTFDPMTPDGAISTTAADVAHFMVAQLEQGRFDGAEILDPATTELMHRRSFAADPRLAGFAHGFMDRTVNGHRVLGHDGSWEGFESVLMLVPDCDLGLFVSANATGGVAALTDVLRDFENRFLLPVPAAAVSGGAHAAPRQGFYQPARHNASTVEKLTNLLGPLRLSVRPDGSLHFKGTGWTTSGDGLYTSADGRDHLVFRAAGGGRFYAATDGAAYQLMDVADTLPVNLAVLAALAVLGLSAAAVPAAAGWRRLPRRRATGARRALSPDWRASRALAASAAGLWLLFLVLLTVTLLGDTSAFLYAVPTGFTVLLVLPVAVLLTGAAALAGTVAGWRRSGAGVVGRVHQVALLAGLVGFSWFVVHWNLLGWRYR